VEARKRYLILNGRINEFLHNRETAAELGIEHSNASARANSYAVEPIVRMSNTYIEKGDYTKDEIFEHFTGVYIKSFTEWNIDDKRYNQKYVGRESYYVENGEIRYPIRRPILEITTPGFYSAVDAVGNDIERFAGTCGKGEPAQGIPVDMGGPTIRLRNVKLGGR
jgi:TldD protein